MTKQTIEKGNCTNHKDCIQIVQKEDDLIGLIPENSPFVQLVKNGANIEARTLAVVSKNTNHNAHPGLKRDTTRIGNRNRNARYIHIDHKQGGNNTNSEFYRECFSCLPNCTDSRSSLGFLIQKDSSKGHHSYILEESVHECQAPSRTGDELATCKKPKEIEAFVPLVYLSYYEDSGIKNYLLRGIVKVPSGGYQLGKTTKDENLPKKSVKLEFFKNPYFINEYFVFINFKFNNITNDNIFSLEVKHPTKLSIELSTEEKKTMVGAVDADERDDGNPFINHKSPKV